MKVGLKSDYFLIHIGYGLVLVKYDTKN